VRNSGGFMRERVWVVPALVEPRWEPGASHELERMLLRDVGVRFRA